MQIQRRFSLESLIGRRLCNLLILVERQLRTSQYDEHFIPRPLRRLNRGVLPFVLAHQSALEHVFVCRTAPFYTNKNEKNSDLFYRPVSKLDSNALSLIYRVSPSPPRMTKSKQQNTWHGGRFIVTDSTGSLCRTLFPPEAPKRRFTSRAILASRLFFHTRHLEQLQVKQNATRDTSQIKTITKKVV